MELTFAKLFIGATATIALYSILYKENKFYRLFEHIYIGLAVGFSIVALWTENLQAGWWDKMLGNGAGQATAYPFYALLLPLGFMGFLVFSKKHGWMARIPIGILLGAVGGQQLGVFQTGIMPQVRDSMVSIVPTTFSSMTIPNGITLSPAKVTAIAGSAGVTEEAVTVIAQNFNPPEARMVEIEQQFSINDQQFNAVASGVRGVVQNEVYPTQAINNIIFLFTLLSVLLYFIFSVEMKSKTMTGITRAGRLLLMVGFGAIFGSTVMTRFALLIDRMNFIFVEFIQQGIFHK